MTQKERVLENILGKEKIIGNSHVSYFVKELAQLLPLSHSACYKALHLKGVEW